MKTVAHSLKILHDLKIVHGDLKPSNVLIKRTELGYTTKLIDFDNAYIAGRPPPPEEIVGTINYYSPSCSAISRGRVFLRANSAFPPTSSRRSDSYRIPDWSAAALRRRCHEPAVAVRNRETLRIPRREIPTQLADLVDAMLAPEPVQRPTIQSHPRHPDGHAARDAGRGRTTAVRRSSG